MAADIETLFAEAVRRQQAGDADGAAALYREIIAVEPRYAAVHTNLGLALATLGDDKSAVASYRRALGLEPGRADALNGLGNALRRMDRLADARRCFEEILARKPDDARALNNLGLVLLAAGDIDEAVGAFRRAVALAPQTADAHANLGNALREAGSSEPALESYRRALARDPAHVGALAGLAAVCHERGRIDLAASALETAIDHAPGSKPALRSLAGIREEQGLAEEARRWLGKLAALAPDEPVWRLRLAGLFPFVMPDTHAIAGQRAKLEALLDDYAAAGVRIDPLSAQCGTLKPSFQLPYHGADDLPLKRKFAALIDVAPEPPRIPRTGDRPRAAFVVSPRHEGIFLKFMGGIVDRLSRDRVAPAILCGASGIGKLRAGLGNPDIELRPVKGDLPSFVAGARDAAADILYFFEVGTDDLNYLLPFFRLAPVQCVSWGFPVTTGIPAVTHFLSSDLVEPSGAESHYSERLVRLATLPTYYRRPPAPPGSRRAALGLPEDRTLYLCPQSLAKLHPDFDAVLAAILGGDPRGVVVIVGHRRDDHTDAVRARFRRSMPDVADRVFWLQQQRPDNFLAVIANADVMLDTFAFGGGNTTYEALALGTPVVTCPGAFMRGRVTLGCYRKIGVMDCVAATPEDYVRIAVGLGTDRDFRQSVSAKILAANDALYEDEGAVRALEDFLEAAVRAAVV